MTLKKQFGIAIFALGLIVAGSELGETLDVPGVEGVVSDAQAVIGMPLTPLSVAGVARRTTRRTVRRCEMGVGYC